MTKRVYYFEDLAPGTVLEFGDAEMTAEAIIEFARQFDPQPFHIDPEAAKTSLFGGLCASGWHTASVMMRLWVDNYLSPEASLGSPGVDEVRWHRPVFPGDRLSCRVEILDCHTLAQQAIHGHCTQQVPGAEPER